MRRTGSESLDQEPIGKIVGRRKTTRITLVDAELIQWVARPQDQPTSKASPESAELSPRRKSDKP